MKILFVFCFLSFFIFNLLYQVLVLELADVVVKVLGSHSGGCADCILGTDAESELLQDCSGPLGERMVLCSDTPVDRLALCQALGQQISDDCSALLRASLQLEDL